MVDIASRWPKKKDKILQAEFDGNLYYPFDDKWIWFLPGDLSTNKWKLIPYPKEILYNPIDTILIEVLASSCNCSSLDLFNFGCRC